MARVLPTSITQDGTHTGDMQTPTLSPINLDTDRESIIQPLDNLLRTAELQQAAFMEEVMIIRIERGRDKNSPQWVDVHVNGVVQWIKIGEPQKIKRKFVEVLARAQPYSVETVHGTTQEERPQNGIRRSGFAQYPFSVLRDPNAMGDEWLQRVFLEN